MAVSKAKLRREVEEFCRVAMYQFLRDEVGLVPSVDNFIRNVYMDSMILDWFSADELYREFLVFSGLSEMEVRGVGLKFPVDFSRQIRDGSFRGLVEWLEENVWKVCRDEDVSWFFLVELREGEFLIMIPDEVIKEQELREKLEERGYRIVGVWRFRLGERFEEDEIDKWQRFLEVMKLWRTKKVGVVLLSELGDEVEEVRGKVVEFLRSVDEAISLERLYQGSEIYRRVQPGVVRRAESGETVMVYKVLDMYFIPFWGTGELHVYGKVESEEKGRRMVYSPRVVVEGVEMSEEWSEYTPIKLLDRKTGEEFYIGFIDPDVDVRVWCSCPDFQFRFYYPLKRMGAVQGPFKPPGGWRPSGRPRKSQNWRRVPAACKHLYALIEVLVRNRLVSDLKRYGREIDLTKGLVV